MVMFSLPMRGGMIEREQRIQHKSGLNTVSPRSRHAELLILCARMGYPKAASRRADSVRVPSARIVTSRPLRPPVIFDISSRA